MTRNEMGSTRAVRIHENGGPEVLKAETIDLPAPRAGEVLVRQTAIGLNFLDVYHRSGLYPLDLPSGLGMEAAGIVELAGPSVTEFREGDRVGYATGPIGAYAERRVCPVEKLIPLPDDVSDETAAAVLLKGMTVEFLFHRTFPLQKGDTILFHAAAGGVGLLACQWARSIGCRVIGTVGSPEKARLAREHGCGETIEYRNEDIVRRVRELTDGRGVKVVYDSVGRDTFDASLESLQKRGMLVSFGQASGPVPEINLRVFAPKSLYYTRPSLFNYCATREELLESARRVFAQIRGGHLKIEVRQRYPLFSAADAHRDLESRGLAGSTLLIP